MSNITHQAVMVLSFTILFSEALRMRMGEYSFPPGSQVGNSEVIHMIPGDTFTALFQELYTPYSSIIFLAAP